MYLNVVGHSSHTMQQDIVQIVPQNIHGKNKLVFVLMQQDTSSLSRVVLKLYKAAAHLVFAMVHSAYSVGHAMS